MALVGKALETAMAAFGSCKEKTEIDLKKKIGIGNLLEKMVFVDTELEWKVGKVRQKMVLADTVRITAIDKNLENLADTELEN